MVGQTATPFPAPAGRSVTLELMRELKQRDRWALLACLVMTPALGLAQQVPRKSPEFVIQIPKGPQLLLSQFRGKVVALEFLFTTCPHCQHSSQLMSKLYTELKPKGFQPLGVAFNEGAEQMVPLFVQGLRVNYPVGVASQQSVYNYMGISIMQRLVVPQIVLIDRQGVIRVQTSAARGQEDIGGEPELRAKIEALLDAPPPHHPGSVQHKRKNKS